VATIRFVHAADLHLDATFGGVDVSDRRVAEQLTRSTLDALDRIVDLCIARTVDFLLIAGDLYNSADRSLRAQLHFQRAARRLHEAGIPVFAVHGNHDPADGWSAGLDLPESVHVFPTDRVGRQEVRREGKLVCAVYGRSYATRQVTDNLAGGFARAADDPLAVGLLHTNVGGREGHEDYAPCTVADLRAAAMDYWALGHIHLWGRVADDPPAAYSGSSQGLHPGEEGPRGCLYVELGADGSSEEFVETAAVRWRGLVVDASSAEDVEEVLGELAKACGRARDEAGGRSAVVRIELAGRTAVHRQLSRPGVMDDILGELRQQQLLADPWIWVDRVRDRTQPDLDLVGLATEEGLLGDVVRAAAAAVDPEAAQHLLEATLEPVLKQLAIDIEPGMTPQQVIERARDLCLDALVGESE
jgi:DNA repair exonuclease SbcCD nuclease subunit